MRISGINGLATTATGILMGAHALLQPEVAKAACWVDGTGFPIGQFRTIPKNNKQFSDKVIKTNREDYFQINFNSSGAGKDEPMITIFRVNQNGETAYNMGFTINLTIQSGGFPDIEIGGVKFSGRCSYYVGSQMNVEFTPEKPLSEAQLILIAYELKSKGLKIDKKALPGEIVDKLLRWIGRSQPQSQSYLMPNKAKNMAFLSNPAVQTA